MIENFLKELRESADIQFKIFTEGSCFRLYIILKTIYPKAKPYWSDLENHCVTKINGKFYDIGGEIKKSYVKDRSFYEIPKDQMNGYKILKWVSEDDSLGTKVEKYK